jgi:hypothetical protein
VAAVVLSWAAFAPVESGSRDEVFEIPKGTWSRRMSGDKVEILPDHIRLTLGVRDILVLRNDDGLRVFSLGEPQDTEAGAIQRFFDGMEKYVPQLVSWNGRSFDLPVLVSRGMINAVRAACFWETGGEAKFNNYVNRFHDRHVDLMDVLSIYGGRGSPPDELARLAGFPGKLGVGGGAVWDSYRAGRLEAIRNYCEADTLNTYLLYLRFQMMRCAYTRERYESECQLVRSTLERRPEPHWREFLSLWQL